MSPHRIDAVNPPGACTPLPDAAQAPAFAGGAFPPLTDQAVLVVTPRCKIEYCTGPARQLLEGAGHALEGERLATLMPQMPLRSATPGYNCAYLVFNHPAGSWHALSVTGADGKTIRLEASFLIIPMGNSARILIGLRPVASAPADDHFQRFLARMEDSDEAVVVTDLQGVIEYVNPAYARLSGWQRHELVGRPRPLAACAAAAGAPGTGSQVRDTLRVERVRSGRIRYLDEQVRPFCDHTGRVTHYVSTARDVSRRIAHERALQRRANFDSLTGIPNRHLLIQRLNQEISRTARADGAFAVICADMDRLKAINDTFGHAAGDVAIRAVADHLSHGVREMDTVGRFGGDEFVLIVPDLHRPEDVDALLDKLVASVRNVRVGTPSPLRLALSVGAAIFPRDGENAGALLHAADAAMYKAKRLGGDRYWPCAAPAPSSVPLPTDRPAARRPHAIPLPPPSSATALHQVSPR